jgi:hypothetical protein
MKITRLKGGTYCEVFRYRNRKVDYIIKTFGDGKVTKKISNIIISDFLRQKLALSKLGIKVPNTLKIYYSSKAGGEIVIIEEFCGTSLREILRNTKIDSTRKKDFIRLGLEFICQLPEGIPLDTGPGNLAINKNGDISFIDFIPPEPWKYKKDKSINEALDTIFPAMKSNIYKNKYESYHVNKYRQKRFLYHCKTLLDKVENATRAGNIIP